jgi:hypothetical protein
MIQRLMDFDAAPVPREREKRTLAERFADHDRERPELYAEFKAICEQLLAKGVQHYGAKSVFEYIRFHRRLNGRDADGYKCNNSFVSLYVRKLLQERPDMAGLFETRQLRSG